jgi:hypothetical protein
MRAYIVVAMGPGKSRDVARKIASLPGVKMADACGAPATYSPWLKLQSPRSSTN